MVKSTWSFFIFMKLANMEHVDTQLLVVGSRSRGTLSIHWFFHWIEHLNWSSSSGVMIGRSWIIKFGKIYYLFPNLIFQLLCIITPLILDQLTWSLPKNVTTFHWQQEGIIHFCLSPNKWGVLAIWKKLINQVWKSPLTF